MLRHILATYNQKSMKLSCVSDQRYHHDYKVQN